jgi:hypothetical protein
MVSGTATINQGREVVSTIGIVAGIITGAAVYFGLKLTGRVAGPGFYLVSAVLFIPLSIKAISTNPPDAAIRAALVVILSYRGIQARRALRAQPPAA